MFAPFQGMPAAVSFEQSIAFAQLEILRRINRAREQGAK